MPINSIKKKRHSEVFVSLKESIVNGHYHNNERLPSERELADAFKVARGTIRSALEQLEMAGYVKKKSGSGTFVTHYQGFDTFNIEEDVSPLELIDARLAIEPYIVKLVILNANQRSLREIENTLREATKHCDNPNDFSHYDEAFHLMLARCSQNPLLEWIYGKINDIRSHKQWNDSKQAILSEEKMNNYCREHRALFEAIKKRDQIEASVIITNHLLRAKRHLSDPLDV
jgi:DNA-binding FadR family transcriptional regulator